VLIGGLGVLIHWNVAPHSGIRYLGLNCRHLISRWEGILSGPQWALKVASHMKETKDASPSNWRSPASRPATWFSGRLSMPCKLKYKLRPLLRYRSACNFIKSWSRSSSWEKVLQHGQKMSNEAEKASPSMSTKSNQNRTVDITWQTWWCPVNPFQLTICRFPLFYSV
jgi:hypothetical protein